MEAAAAAAISDLPQFGTTTSPITIIQHPDASKQNIFGEFDYIENQNLNLNLDYQDPIPYNQNSQLKTTYRGPKHYKVEDFCKDYKENYEAITQLKDIYRKIIRMNHDEEKIIYVGVDSKEGEADHLDSQGSSNNSSSLIDAENSPNSTQIYLPTANNINDIKKEEQYIVKHQPTNSNDKIVIPGCQLNEALEKQIADLSKIPNNLKTTAEINLEIQLNKQMGWEIQQCLLQAIDDIDTIFIKYFYQYINHFSLKHHNDQVAQDYIKNLFNIKHALDIDFRMCVEHNFFVTDKFDIEKLKENGADPYFYHEDQYFIKEYFVLLHNSNPEFRDKFKTYEQMKAHWVGVFVGFITGYKRDL